VREDVREVIREVVDFVVREIGRSRELVGKRLAVLRHVDRRAVDEGSHVRDTARLGGVEEPALPRQSGPVVVAEVLVVEGVGPTPDVRSDVVSSATARTDVETPHRQSDSARILVFVEPRLEEQIGDGLAPLERPLADELDRPGIRRAEMADLLTRQLRLDGHFQRIRIGRREGSVRSRITRHVARDVQLGAGRSNGAGDPSEEGCEAQHPRRRRRLHSARRHHSYLMRVEALDNTLSAASPRAQVKAETRCIGSYR